MGVLYSPRKTLVPTLRVVTIVPCYAYQFGSDPGCRRRVMNGNELPEALQVFNGFVRVNQFHLPDLGASCSFSVPQLLSQL